MSNGPTAEFGPLSVVKPARHSFIYLPGPTSFIKNLPAEPCTNPDETEMAIELLRDPVAFYEAGYAIGVGDRAPKRGILGDAVRVHMDQASTAPLLTPSGEVFLGRGIMAGQQIVLNPDSVRRNRDTGLILEAAGLAYDRLFRSNLALALSFATKKRQHMPHEDAIQVADTGLMHACSIFDWRRGNRFSTHASWWIQQAIQNEKPKYKYAMRVQKDVFADINSLTRFLDGLDDGPLSDAELSEKMGWNIDRLAKTRAVDNMLGRIVSLDEPIDGHNGATRLDLAQGHNESMDGGMVVEAIINALKKLPPDIGKVIIEDKVGPALFGVERVSEGKNNNRIRRMYKGMAMLKHPGSGLVELFDQSGYADIFTDVACCNLPIEWFFTGEIKGVKTEGTIARAKACRQCPEAKACAQFADKHDIKIGYFGGQNRETFQKNQRKATRMQAVQTNE